MKIAFHNKVILLVSLFLLNFSIVEAKCKFIMDIGGRYIKSHEKKYGPLSEDETGYAEVEILAPDLCPNDNFDDNFIIKHIFLDQKLMAIQFYVDNSIDNSPTESMKLMNYAKRNYGDFDTSNNPKSYIGFEVIERVNEFIIYQRLLNDDATIDEQIYISNPEQDNKFMEYVKNLEEQQLKEEQ